MEHSGDPDCYLLMLTSPQKLPKNSSTTPPKVFKNQTPTLELTANAQHQRRLRHEESTLMAALQQELTEEEAAARWDQ